MEKERFHIGQTGVGSDPMGPNEATVTWIDDHGQKVTADLGEGQLESKIAERQARGGDPTVFVEALAKLRQHPNRRQ
jgi:hypothetical protein